MADDPEFLKMKYGITKNIIKREPLINRGGVIGIGKSFGMY